MTGTWWYWVSIICYCLVLSKTGYKAFMPVHIEKSGDLVGCYHSGTKDRTNKEKLSYSANGPWTAEMSNYKFAGVTSFQVFVFVFHVRFSCVAYYPRRLVSSAHQGFLPAKTMASHPFKSDQARRLKTAKNWPKHWVAVFIELFFFRWTPSC